MRLKGGLRVNVFNLPITILEQVLGVRLELEDDLELGGAYYSYAPYPLSRYGLEGVRLHFNDVPDFGLTYDSRPDLIMMLSIEFCSNNLLDLGRLEWRLRAAYGDLFDVVAYSVRTQSPPDDPSGSIGGHWVQFAAAASRRGVPLGDTPVLACSVDFELAEGAEASVLAAVAGLNDSAAVLTSTDSHSVGERRVRLSVRFDSPSLLELGRYAQLVDLAFGNAVRVLGYLVCGDLQRDGKLLRIERDFTSQADSLPFWDASASAP